MEQLREFIKRAQKQLGLSRESLTVCLVTNAQIAHWNRTYRRKHGPTDVLSFPAETKARKPSARMKQTRRREANAADRATGRKTFTANYLGDIALAPAVARRNARRFGRSFEDEMRILILHGMLHLMGYDHETDTGQMDRRERRLRRKLGLTQ